MLVTGESVLRTADSSPKPQTLNQFCAARPFEVLPGYTLKPKPQTLNPRP